MIDLYNLDPGDGRLQVFLASGGTNFQTWQKPRGISQVMVACVGGGGGGGAGLTAVAGNARGGGSGGGSAAITRAVFSAFAIQDTLYIRPGLGGAGGSAGPGLQGSSSVVMLRPDTSLAVNLTLCVAAQGSGGSLGTATTNSGGSAGTVTTLSNGAWLAAGNFVSFAGQSGGAGGAGGTSGATPTGVTVFSSTVVSGGAGGGSTGSNNGAVAGGSILLAGLLEQNRNASAGVNGPDGVSSLSPFWSTGGAGGGSSATTGGNGGSGGYGSGGGGGGGGTTGGAGGRGGDGIVIIYCW